MVRTIFVYEEIFSLLKHVDPSKSGGPHKISNRMLKFTAESISPVIINFCITSDWKLSFICPTHKNGSKSLLTNYRLISLLCPLSKVLEHHMFNIFVDIIMELKPFSFHQWEFLPNFVQSALINVTDVWSRYLDMHMGIAVFVTLRKPLTLYHMLLYLFYWFSSSVISMVD